MEAVQDKAAEEIVAIDEKGHMVVNKETEASQKLLARRAIEAHRECKMLEKSINEYDFDFEDLDA